LLIDTTSLETLEVNELEAKLRERGEHVFQCPGADLGAVGDGLSQSRAAYEVLGNCTVSSPFCEERQGLTPSRSGCLSLSLSSWAIQHPRRRAAGQISSTEHSAKKSISFNRLQGFLGALQPRTGPRQDGDVRVTPSGDLTASSSTGDSNYAGDYFREIFEKVRKIAVHQFNTRDAKGITGFIFQAPLAGGRRQWRAPLHAT
jgi:hypothetical protein